MLLNSLLPDSSRITADMAVEFIIEHPEMLRDFIDASLLQEYPLSMRASRVVHLYGQVNPAFIRPHLKEILDALQSLHDQSVIRCFLHIFDAFIQDLPDAELGQLLRLCFDYLEDLTAAIAVRVYSLKLLYLISRRLPEIKPEIIAIIHYHLPESTSAFKSQARQIIGKLQKEIIPES